MWTYWRRYVIPRGFSLPHHHRLRCEPSAFPSHHHHGFYPSETLGQIKYFLFQVALVMLFCHSNREVAKTLLNGCWEILKSTWIDGDPKHLDLALLHGNTTKGPWLPTAPKCPTTIAFPLTLDNSRPLSFLPLSLLFPSRYILAWRQKMVHGFRRDANFKQLIINNI